MELKYFPPQFECAPVLARAGFWLRRSIGNIDVVHSNADYGLTFRRAGKPLIATVHHNVFDDGYQKFTNLAQKTYHFGLLKRRLWRVLKEADRIIAVSHSTKNSLERSFRARNVEVIYNGIDTELFRPKEIQPSRDFAGRVRLLFTGNLIKRKGADLLPLIMQKLGSDYALFYTTGLRIHTKFKTSNMVMQVVGTKKDMVDLYNATDIFVFPSRLEGFGYSVAEAMACGKPIVCTDSSSMPELVIDQKGGLLCRLNDVNDFVEKIKFLGARPDLCRCMGAFNRDRIVTNFSLTRMISEYLPLYRSLI
jgi:glycosyltransferase involved in cell wall biosynthesis